MKRKIEKINRSLLNHFGIPKRKAELPDPLDLLIATILSQNTNDASSFKAFNNLKSKYPNWNEAAVAKRSGLERLIKTAGLGKQKSKAIKEVLSSLKKENGEISLKYLEEKRNEEVLDYLTKFNGVGIKTASCVLLFSFDRNVCPVDTHVHRTLNRIGIVHTSSPEKTYDVINRNLPKATAHSFHTNLIRLGREICKPQKPSCSNCPLIKFCSYENKNFGVQTNRLKRDFMLLDNV